jgi:hypothetical protein
MEENMLLSIRLRAIDPTKLSAFIVIEARIMWGCGVDLRKGEKSLEAANRIPPLVLIAGRIATLLRNFGPKIRKMVALSNAASLGRVWFGFFLNSFSEKLAVGKSWLLGKAGG